MAEDNRNIFQRLGSLFTSNIVVRQTPTGKLKVKDIDMSQVALTNNFIDRYQKLMKNTYGKFANQQNPSFSAQRIELFKDYELMDTDPIISSALDIYSDESTVDDIEGEILTIKTDNAKLHKILHNLFYDILNVEFNLWSWIRNLCKYGDLFLQLDIVDKYGIVNVKPLSAYDVERMEEHDPSEPTKVEFKILSNMQTSGHGTAGEEVMKQQYEIAHFRLLSDANFLPYGKSQLEGARKIFKQLTLMEDAMLIHRIMRAPEKRVFKVDIGNIPPNEVDNFMNKLINKMKKTPVIDQATGDYNLRYNIESVAEDFFLPVRGGDSGTAIETLQGLSNEGQIDDIEYLRNKLMAALRIPKAFLGYEEGVGSKATLAAEDVRFSRTIERLQKIVLSELEKIAIVHLYTQGFDDAELISFDLELTNPSMIHEQEKLELLTQQVEIASSLMENRMFSREWIYDNIFEMNDHDKDKVFNQVIEDQKQAFRMEQIVNEGNDPAVTGEKEDMMGGTSGMGAGGQGRTGGSPFSVGESDWGGSEKDRFKIDVNPHGASTEDQRKAVSYEKGKNGKREFKGKSPLATSKGATLVKKESVLAQLKKQYSKENTNSGLLSEDKIFDEDQKNN